MQTPTIGRIVHYKLSSDDAIEIANRRENFGMRGNPVSEGMVVPMMMVAIFENEFGPGIPGVNGRLILDGNDLFWVTSRREGTDRGQWTWPART